MRVLLIEDDAKLRESIKGVIDKLLPEGSTLRAPESAEETRQIFDWENFDVLILDMNLGWWGQGLMIWDFEQDILIQRLGGDAKIFCASADEWALDEMIRVMKAEDSPVFMKTHIGKEEFNEERRKALLGT